MGVGSDSRKFVCKEYVSLSILRPEPNPNRKSGWRKGESRAYSPFSYPLTFAVLKGPPMKPAQSSALPTHRRFSVTASGFVARVLICLLFSCTALALAQAQQPFDPSRGILLRGTVVTMD